MNNLKIYCTCLFLLGFVVFASNADAQINVDSLFNVAIQHSRVQEYDKSIQKANEVLTIDSSRDDVCLFIANVYAWKGEYETSKGYIQKVYNANPKDSELYNSWLNVLLWNKEYQELIATIKIARDNRYDNKYNLTLKEALAYKGMQQYAAGIRAINQQSSLLDSVVISDLYNQLKNLDKSNVVSAYYRVDFFDISSMDPQHLAYVDYGLRTKKDIWILRLNYANRFNRQDFQPEIDWYHNFTNGHYFYANYAFGVNETLFARHRLGFEYYLPFGNGYEASLGLRYMNFPTGDSFVYTGSVAKYITNWWICFRPYVAVKDGAYNFTALLNARMYGNNPINYWEGELSYGNSPDDLFFYPLGQSNEWYDAFRVRIARNMSLGKVNELKFSVGYGHEEIRKDTFRNRFIFDILFKHRF